ARPPPARRHRPAASDAVRGACRWVGTGPGPVRRCRGCGLACPCLDLDAERSARVARNLRANMQVIDLKSESSADKCPRGHRTVRPDAAFPYTCRTFEE